MRTHQHDLQCPDCEHCFRKSELFKLLSREELNLFNDSKYEAQYKPGEIIYKQGTPLTHLVIIYEGLGKIYLESSEGRDLILRYTRNLALNGGIGVFIDMCHHSTLMAVTNCKACFISVGAFQKVMDTNAEFRKYYLKRFSMKVQHTYNHFSVLTHKNVEGRMADVIIYLKDEIFGGGVIKNISRKDLAEITAMTRESTSRVLKDFKEDGLIELAGNSIKIVNQQALETVSSRG